MSNIKERAFHAFELGYTNSADRYNGAFLPSIAAPIIAAELSATESQENILHLLQRPPVEESVYPDVFPVLQSVVRSPNQVLSIWTQGEVVTEKGEQGYQILKVAASGLSRALNPDWKKKSGEYGVPRVIGGIDKHQVLPDMAAKAKQLHLEQLVIVDDKEENLARADAVLSDSRIAKQYFHITRKKKPQGYIGTGIDSFAQIPVADLARTPTLWLVDLDYTIIDHKMVRNNLVEQIAAFMS